MKRKTQDGRRLRRYKRRWLVEGTDKSANQATGMLESPASFDLKTCPEWAIAQTHRALKSPSSSASPRLRVGLSVPNFLCVVSRS